MTTTLLRRLVVGRTTVAFWKRLAEHTTPSGYQQQDLEAECLWAMKRRASVSARGGVEKIPETEQQVVVERREEGKVGLLTLSRPQALNALSSTMMTQFTEGLRELQADPKVGAVVVAGAGRAFAAGADIGEMRNATFAAALQSGMLRGWEAAMGATRKATIAAVHGYALGGGCELAMMCDIMLVGEGAVFGQPEVKLGVIPGMGGTQRLIRAVGKSRAMEMILSGEAFLSAEEAVRLGLASRVVPGDREAVVEAAVQLGAKVAAQSAPVVALAKDSVLAAMESTLETGLESERARFYACFSLDDQTEGMDAFLEKRKPAFSNR